MITQVQISWVGQSTNLRPSNTTAQYCPVKERKIDKWNWTKMTLYELWWSNKRQSCRITPSTFATLCICEKQRKTQLPKFNLASLSRKIWSCYFVSYMRRWFSQNETNTNLFCSSILRGQEIRVEEWEWGCTVGWGPWQGCIFPKNCKLIPKSICGFRLHRQIARWYT